MNIPWITVAQCLKLCKLSHLALEHHVGCVLYMFVNEHRHTVLKWDSIPMEKLHGTLPFIIYIKASQEAV